MLKNKLIDLTNTMTESERKRFLSILRKEFAGDCFDITVRWGIMLWKDNPQDAGRKVRIAHLVSYVTGASHVIVLESNSAELISYV